MAVQLRAFAALTEYPVGFLATTQDYSQPPVTLDQMLTPDFCTDNTFIHPGKTIHIKLDLEIDTYF